ncbi:UNVERIFIED_CONTAM: hypothetical protein FKN15_024332 [Acipenser sinensis]
MDEKAQNKSTLISRLPKFGVKSPVSSSLANGACISLPGQPQGGKMGGSRKQNGVVLTPSCSLNWRKANRFPNDVQTPEEGGETLDNAKGGDGGRLQQPVVRLRQPEAKKATSSSPGKGKRTPVSAARTDVAPQTLPQTTKATNRNAFPSRGTWASCPKAWNGWTKDCKVAGLADEVESSLTASQAPLPFSLERDFPTGSSLELSPSDSSDGTYMWDEEGLEPLGSAPHHCGSYDDSVEINSLDILNNLDNLESCDLDDDDLMLDVDLPEDGSLNNVDAENMSHLERGRRHGQGYWRRRPQQRWTGQEHFQHDNRGPVFLGSPAGQYDGYSAPNFDRTPQENIVALDELTLCHMTQDCTSVKNQLLKLQQLLQIQELLNEICQLKEELKSKDDTIKQLQQQMSTRCHCHKRTPESKEMRQRHNDKATQTAWRGNPVRCAACPLLLSLAGFVPGDPSTQRSAPQTECCTIEQRSPRCWGACIGASPVLDKVSLSTWCQSLPCATVSIKKQEEQLPQILHPSSPRRTDTPSKGRLARSTPTEDPSSCPGSTLHNANDSRLQQPQQTVLPGPVSGPPAAAHSAPALGDPAAEQHPDPDKLSFLLSSPLKIDEADRRPAEPHARHNSFGRSLQIQPLPDVSPLASNGQVKMPPRLSKKLSKRHSPCLLQPPRFHNRVLKASEVSEVPAATKGKSPESSLNHKKTLESRPNSKLQPSNTALLFKTKQPPQLLETQPDSYSESKDSVSTQPLTSLGLPRSLVQRDSSAQLSRLPKPKVH